MSLLWRLSRTSPPLRSGALDSRGGWASWQTSQAKRAAMPRIAWRLLRGKGFKMGYRSTVVISTSHDGYSKLVSQLWRENGLQGIMHPLVGIDVWGNKCTFDFHDEAADGVICGFENIKWYGTFEEIQAFEDVLEKLEDAGVPWCFVRIGEDYDDIEYRTTDNAFDFKMPHVYPETSWTCW